MLSTRTDVEATALDSTRTPWAVLLVVALHSRQGLSSCRSMCLDSVYRSTKFLLANAFDQKKGFNLKTFEQFFSPSQKCKFRPCVRLAKVISLNYKWTNGLNPGRRRMYLSVWGRGWWGDAGWEKHLFFVRTGIHVGVSLLPAQAIIHILIMQILVDISS